MTIRHQIEARRPRILFAEEIARVMDAEGIYIDWPRSDADVDGGGLFALAERRRDLRGLVEGRNRFDRPPRVYAAGKIPFPIRPGKVVESLLSGDDPESLARRADFTVTNRRYF